jgi:hypothetical protein
MSNNRFTRKEIVGGGNCAGYFWLGLTQPQFNAMFDLMVEQGVQVDSEGRIFLANGMSLKKTEITPTPKHILDTTMSMSDAINEGSSAKVNKNDVILLSRAKFLAAYDIYCELSK